MSIWERLKKTIKSPPFIVLSLTLNHTFARLSISALKRKPYNIRNKSRWQNQQLQVTIKTSLFITIGTPCTKFLFHARLFRHPVKIQEDRHLLFSPFLWVFKLLSPKNVSYYQTTTSLKVKSSCCRNLSHTVKFWYNGKFRTGVICPNGVNLKFNK